jgi:hypothetical protein
MPLDPLRVVYVWPAPKSRFVVSGLSRTRATLAGTNAPRFLGSCIHFLRTTLSCRSALARDLPGTGSKSCACGMSGIIESPDFATAARQIAGKVEHHPGRSYGLRPESKADRSFAMLAS